MKRLTRRLLSLLLAVCIVLSLLTGLTLLVSAVGENAIRNWGVRDTVCTQLSSSALSYYTDNYTYASLKALPGASSTSNSLTAAQNNQLFNALHTLMEDTHDSAAISGITYSSHSTWYAYTDCENGATNGSMNLLWCSKTLGAWNGDLINREHVWCKSHATYLESNGGADLHHLRPANSYINQQPHNNRPYGTVEEHSSSTQEYYKSGTSSSATYDYNYPGGWYQNATTAYPDGLYEPPDNAKGDCARIILYVYTRWKQPNLYTSLDTTSSAYLNFVEQTPEGTCDGTYCIESLSTLLSWCALDPVDTWEMGRNDSVQSIQGNRNVFIDYPELAWYLFGMTPPSSMTTPSGDAANNGVSYSITNVTVNNQIYGTATITNSNTVTITPAAGCYIQSATSTSGTVSINGNVITVNGMTANATVNVVLAQNASYTVSFTVPSGVTQAAMTGYANDTITLPTPTGTPSANAHNYEFLGWVSGSVNDTTTQPTYYAANSSYTITGNATLTALYRYTENTGSGATDFDPNGQGGTFVLAANVNGTYYGLPVSGLGSARPVGSTITVTNGAVTAANASGYEWTLAPSGTGFTISDGNGTYLTYYGSSTSLASDTSGYVWNVTANDATSWQFICPNATTRALLFRAGSYNYFAAYAINNLTNYATEYFPLELLPIGNGAASQTYYTTNLTTACSHNYGSWTSNSNGTHSKTCSLCGNVVTESCTYTTSVSGLTTTYTCSICGYSYQTTLDSYTVSYNVRGTVTNTETVTEGNSVTLPTAPAYTGYTFVGWTTGAINPESTTVPTTLTGTYTPTASITLYAVYSRVAQGAGSAIYTLVSSISDGDQVVIYNPGNSKAVNNSMNGYYVAGVDVTTANNVITNLNNAAVWTVTANANGTYTFTSGSNELSADVSGNYKNLYVETGHKNTWTLESLNAGNSIYLVYNSELTATYSHVYLEWYATKSGFSAYDTSATNATETNFGFQFYKYGTSDVTYYTTQPTVLCEHTSTTLNGYVAATCTTAGYTGDYICDSCGATVTAGSVIPALGHDYNGTVTTAATCTSAGVTTYTCSRCNDTYTDNTVPVALGHSYTSAVTTAATCGAAGVRTYTCSRCNDSYTEAIPATGSHSYGAWSSNSNGTHTQTCSVCGDVVSESCSYSTSVSGATTTFTCTVCAYTYSTTRPTYTVTYSDRGRTTSVNCIDGNSVTLPATASTVDGYTFVGWVAAAIDPENSTVPTLLTGSYTPTENVTLYACYTRTVTGDPVEEYRLVTATSQLAAGDEIVIAARDANYAILLNNSSVSRTAVVKSSDNTKLTINSATVFTLESRTDVSGGFAFKSGNNYLTVSRNGLTAANSTSYSNSWKINSINSSNGGAALYAKTRSNSSNTYYLTYSSNAFTTGSRTASTVVFYKKTVTTPQVTYYTTAPICTHEHTTLTGVVAATCTVAGYTGDYVCDDCGEIVTTGTAIAALGHDLVTDPAVAATCTASGLTAGEHCTRCDYAVAQETVPALGHDYQTIYTAPSCGQDGFTTYTCTRCGDTYTDNAVPALGHSYTSAVTTEATCTAAGVRTYTCTRCGDSYTEPISALGHDIVADAAVAATCTASGLTAGSHCTRCDYAVAQETVPALGHDYTYNDDGNGLTHTVGCSRCDYNATENHAYVSGTCVCGAVEVLETLQLVSAAPVLNDKIDMIYAATVPEGYSNPHVVFTFNGTTTDVTQYTTDENGRLCFVFNDINPQCMGDNISATLYATKAGAQETFTVANYSVRQYCVNKLAEWQPAPIRILLSDLLAYGAAAQVYMNYKTNALVTSGDDIVDPMYYDFDEIGPVSGYGASFEGTASTDVFWTSASLTLTSSVAMNFRFYAASTANLSVTVSVNGRSQTFTSFTSIGDGIYEVSFTGIEANEFDDGVTASFARGETALGNTLTYSVNAYVQSKQSDSNTALQDLVRALYLYGVSAEDYGGYVG